MEFTKGRHLILSKMPDAACGDVNPSDTTQDLICHIIDRSAWSIQLAWDQGAIGNLYASMTEKAFKSLAWSADTAVVVVKFRDAGHLRDVIARIDSGEVVDPAAEDIAAFAHSASSSPNIFEDARKHAESLGKRVSDVLAVFTVDRQCHTVVYKM